MSTTKKQVIVALSTNHEKENLRYNELYALLRDSEGVNINQMNYLNRSGFNQSNLSTVIYELKKLHKIHDHEIVKEETVETEETDEKDNIEATLNSGKSAADLHASTGPEQTTFDQALREEIKKILSEASDEVKTEIKFRDEFPFLFNDDCPQELKALVTDKFNHYHKFVEDHVELFDKVVRPYLESKKESETEEQITDDVIFGLAKSVLENFTGDQSIYDELLHYRETKTILGKHPIFTKDGTKDADENPLKDLSAVELAKKKANLDNYIRREKNNAEKATDDAVKNKALDKAEKFRIELEKVDKELNARE